MRTFTEQAQLALRGQAPLLYDDEVLRSPFAVRIGGEGRRCRVRTFHLELDESHTRAASDPALFSYCPTGGEPRETTRSSSSPTATEDRRTTRATARTQWDRVGHASLIGTRQYLRSTSAAIF